MAIKIQSTSAVTNSVTALIYGESGAGKTKLASTAPKPLILSAEAGLLSVAHDNIDSVEIKTPADVMEVYEFLTESKDADKYETIVLDSITEIGEVYLSALKKQHKDARQAYGEYADDLTKLIRAFRDINSKHVYFIAKGGTKDDENGLPIYRPLMPGNTLLQNIPFFFDLVMPLKIGKTEEDKTYRYLLTKGNANIIAKDRSNTLDEFEKPDLTSIFNKIKSGEQKN